MRLYRWAGAHTPLVRPCSTLRCHTWCAKKRPGTSCSTHGSASTLPEYLNRKIKPWTGLHPTSVHSSPRGVEGEITNLPWEGGHVGVLAWGGKKRHALHGRKHIHVQQLVDLCILHAHSIYELCKNTCRNQATVGGVSQELHMFGWRQWEYGE